MITNHCKTVAGLFISHFLIPTCTSNVPHFHFLSSLACVHSCKRPDTWSSSWEILLKQICHSWNLIHGLERPRRTGKRRAVTTCQFRGHSFVPVRHSSPLFQGAFCPLSHHLPCLVNLQSLIALHLDAWLKITRTLTHKIPTVLLRAWTQRNTPDKLSVCVWGKPWPLRANDTRRKTLLFGCSLLLTFIPLREASLAAVPRLHQTLTYGSVWRSLCCQVCSPWLKSDNRLLQLTV